MGALAGAALTVGSAAMVPHRDYPVRWIPAAQTAASVITLLVVVALASIDTLRSDSSRAVPIAAAAAFLAPLVGGRLLAAPGVVGSPLPLLTTRATSLLFSLTTLAFPLLLAAALLLRPRRVEHPLRTVSVAVAAAALLGVSLAVGAYVLAPHLPVTGIGGHRTAFATVLHTLALLPCLAVAMVLARDRRQHLAVGPSVSAALVLLAAQDLVLLGVHHQYEPAWYAEAMLALLPIAALAAGQFALLYQAVGGEVTARRSLAAVIDWQELLQEAVGRLGTSLDVDRIAETAAVSAGRIVRGPSHCSVRAAVFRIDDGVVRSLAVCDSDGTSTQMVTLPLSANPMIARVAATGTTAVGPLRDDQVGPEVRRIVHEARITRGVWIPLHVKGRVWGVLAATARGVEEVGGMRLAFLRQLASRTEVAISNALRYEEARILSEQSADMICRLTPDGRFTYLSAASRTLLGYGPEELLGKSSSDLVDADEEEEYAAALASMLSTTEPVLRVRRFRRKDGCRVWLETTARILRDAGGSAVEIISASRDVTARKHQEEATAASLAEVSASRSRLADLAATDALTGLANRRRFDLLSAEPQTGPFAVLAVDVDNLKVINDAHGHQAGDEVIRAVARTLGAALRDEDVVARTGGDEFTVFLPHTEHGGALALADRLRLAMHGVVVSRGQVRVSVGCASGGAGSSVATVWAAADEALLAAKRDGRDRLGSLAGGQHDQNPLKRWASAAPKLLGPDGMRAVYQPIVHLDTMDVLGYEALVRPTEADDGDDVHGLFAAAERLGFARDLDWVCRRAALRDARELPEGCPVFVKVSSASFLDPVHGADQMALLARWAHRPPSGVVIEISEREVIRDLDRLRVVVGEYRELGFRLALANVGTGHAMLQMLAAVSPEFIKLSTSIWRSVDDPTGGAGIAALAAYATRIGALLIAESVETAEQARHLADHGIRVGQGYALGRPAARHRWQPPAPAGRGSCVARICS